MAPKWGAICETQENRGKRINIDFNIGGKYLHNYKMKFNRDSKIRK